MHFILLSRMISKCYNLIIGKIQPEIVSFFNFREERKKKFPKVRPILQAKNVAAPTQDFIFFILASATTIIQHALRRYTFDE